MRRLHCFIGIALLLALPNAGFADVHFCNEAVSEKVYVSYAIQKQGQWQLSGWYLARPGRCASYIGVAEGEHFYYFAYSTSRSLVWKGRVKVCVEKRPFRRVLMKVEGAGADCASQGLLTKGFQKAKMDSPISTKVLLVPSQGEQETAILYKEATLQQLRIWAKEGDPNARAEFRKRMKQKAPSKPSKKAVIHRNDLQDHDTGNDDSKDAFSLD